jgi:hypothetical protein
MSEDKKIHITAFDRGQRKGLLMQSGNWEIDRYLDALRAEPDLARVVASHEIPLDVITMNTIVSLVDVTLWRRPSTPRSSHGTPTSTSGESP